MAQKLLIECVYKNPKFFDRIISLPVQNEPFCLGLRVENIDKNVFKGCVIKNITIKSQDQQTMFEKFEEEYVIPKLNPNESNTFWLPAIDTFLSKLTWISCDLVPDEKENEIYTYQKYKTGKLFKNTEVNEWGVGSYIIQKSESKQDRTNNLILILTVITTLEAIFTLKGIYNYVIQLLQNALFVLAGSISSIYLK